MYSFEVNGGHKLQAKSNHRVQKRSLEIISAVPPSEAVTIKNIPDIIDVNLLIKLLGEMKVKINRTGGDTCIFRR